MSESNSTSIETADVLAIDSAIMRDSKAHQYGINETGFVAKPFARLLAEKLALARELFGDDLDMTSGSAIRKLFEITALEDARTWSALNSYYDDSFIVTAKGFALSRLGEEQGISRPYNRASGTIKLKLVGTLPSGASEIEIPRGARLLTLGGHHVSTSERVSLSDSNTERVVSVEAFYPGPEHNLDPSVVNTDGDTTQKINQWHPLDSKLLTLFETEVAIGELLIEIEHTEKFKNGETQWSDNRYRSLLLRAPRSIWRVEALEIAVSLIPGVRQVQIKDGWGGLDINQSIFGNFNFIERVFSGERDLGSPYYFSVLVAPSVDAIWEGPDGLRAAIESTIDDLRPVSIFPRIEEASQIGVGIECKLIVKGLPLPTGSRATVNSSIAAKELKKRLMLRVRNYIDGLKFGDPVRTSEVMWALMNEPGIADAQELKLVRYPPSFEEVDFGDVGSLTGKTVLGCGENIQLASNEVPEFVDIDDGIIII